MDNSTENELDFKTSDCPSVIVVKYVSMQATSLIAHAKEKELVRRFHPDIVNAAKNLIKECDAGIESGVVKNAAPALIIQMNEGGLFESLWEMAERTRMGFEIDLNKVPIKQETVEICELYSLNPYELNSKGTLLIVTTHERMIFNALENIDVNAAVVGNLTHNKDKILKHNGIRSCLNRPSGNSIADILDKI